MPDEQFGQELLSALERIGGAATYFSYAGIQSLKKIRDRSELRDLLSRCGYKDVDLSQNATGIAEQLPSALRRRILESPWFWAGLDPTGCVLAYVVLPFKALFAVAEYVVSRTDNHPKSRDP